MMISAIAAYRMARMIVSETGPLAIFARLRRYIDPQQKTWVGVGLNCPYCMGFWASLLFYWSLKFSTSETAHFLIYVLAIAGVQTIIQSWEPIPPPPPFQEVSTVQDAPAVAQPLASDMAMNGNGHGTHEELSHRELQPLSTK